MANLSQFILPVKDTITGVVTPTTFDIAGGGDSTNFVGSREAWNALTTAEKEAYETMDIYGEYNDDPIDSVPTQGSTNAVASGGVYTAIENAKSEIEDPKVYISGVEDTSSASQAYTVGSFLIYDHVLYKVIASIALGDALVVNTNIEATTVGSELTSISNNLTANNSTAGISNVPFRFGVDDDGNFGYIINEGGVDIFMAFSSGSGSAFPLLNTGYYASLASGANWASTSIALEYDKQYSYHAAGFFARFSGEFVSQITISPSYNYDTEIIISSKYGVRGYGSGSKTVTIDEDDTDVFFCGWYTSGLSDYWGRVTFVSR